MGKTLTLTDFYCIAALACKCDVSPIMKSLGGIVSFTVPATDEISKLIKDYALGNLQIDALTFANSIKHYRFHLLQFRQAAMDRIIKSVNEGAQGGIRR